MRGPIRQITECHVRGLREKNKLSIARSLLVLIIDVLKNTLGHGRLAYRRELAKIASERRICRSAETDMRVNFFLSIIIREQFYEYFNIEPDEGA